MLINDDVSQIIADTVRGQLAPCDVDVRIKHDTDDDGDPLLAVTIIIKTNCAPDKRKMLGLVRHIRNNLNEAASVGFPLLSFMSEREAAKLGLETA